MTHFPSLRGCMRSVKSFAAVAALAAAFPALADSGYASAGCQFVNVKVPGTVLSDQVVDLPLGNALNPELTVNGRLCLPKTGMPKTVVLALHGITYTSEYWDSQYQPATYSFVRHMTGAGYAVLAIDRLGYGRSSRPAGSLVTLDVAARVANEMVDQLRAGRIGGRAFPFVAMIGHSYGTATTWLTTALYNNADVIIGTGWGSTIQSLPLARFFSGFYPAALDPKFLGAILDPNYLTPLPGGRNQDYLYDLNNVDAGMIQYDQDVLRDTVTDGEGVTFYNRYGAIPVTVLPTNDTEVLLPLSTHTKNIRVPSFLINGVNELFFCGDQQRYCASGQALYDSQKDYFSPEACLRTAVTPNAGHDLNLQLNAQTSYQVIRTWLDRALGPTGAKRNSYRAACTGGAG